MVAEPRDKNNYTVSVKEGDAWIMKTHIPPQATLDSMEKLRAFIKLNSLPFVVYPISGYRICVRNNIEVDEGFYRFIYKSIMKTTGMCRASNPIWDPEALAYNYYEFETLSYSDGEPSVLNFEFPIEEIQKYYMQYKDKVDNDKDINIIVPEWNNNWIKYPDIVDTLPPPPVETLTMPKLKRQTHSYCNKCKTNQSEYSCPFICEKCQTEGPEHEIFYNVNCTDENLPPWATFVNNNFYDLAMEADEIIVE